MHKPLSPNWLLPILGSAALFVELLHHQPTWLPDAVMAYRVFLPGFLPSLLLTLLLLTLWRALALPALWFPTLFLVVGECVQASGWLPGMVFDPQDVVAILASAALIRLVPIQSWGSRCTYRQAGFILPVLLLSQVACVPLGGISIGWEYSIPIYLTPDDIRKDLVPEYGNTAVLRRPGKLYQQDHRLFVVDNWTGVHIFDVTDNQNPVRIVFLPIPGVTDIEVKNNYLYANSFVDLLSISLADLDAGTFSSSSVSRIEGILTWDEPGSFAANAFYYPRHIGSQTQFLIGYIDPEGNTWLYGDWLKAERSEGWIGK
ncbi:hypothetical protein [Parathalassolituus penaei]|uniref:Uncharacterized protein n=1 Tax=Parathalassolituus penaei TaxID=2997323 RepID=A0A9X3IS60_9GAMM|nr:hypothetical protein [Parathalassolituus penaei]MCY0964940.1 hypothetical protein [Parathalassolituus penaei]